MLTDSSVEKVVIPNSVESLGNSVLYQCEQLHEIVFEPDSRLRNIGDCCFTGSGLRKIVIPKNV